MRTELLPRRFLGHAIVLALGALALLAALAGGPTPGRAAENGWSGTWDTRWPGGGARLILKQDGDTVRGEYPLYRGTLEGTVSDRRLTGTWQEPDEDGRFTFVLSEDGQSFVGRIDPDVWWTGARIVQSAAAPETNISQVTPADTLRAFLIGSEAIENGQLEYLDNVMELLVFEGVDLAKTDELKEATRLWLVLDQFQVQLDAIGVPGPGSDRLALPLTRYDGARFTLDFVRRDGRWFIAVPPPEALHAAFSQLLEASGGRVPPKNAIFRMRTPRDTMEAFIDSMRVGPGGLDTAIATLDLSELSPVGREREAVLIAQYLEQVLARLGEIVLQEIPNDPESETPYIHFTHPKGDIVLAPLETDDGVQWKFTADTLRTVRSLFTATEDMPEASHVLPLYRPDMAVFFRIRQALGEIMPSALSPLGPLEIWQWVAMAAVFAIAILGTAAISLLLMLAGRLGGTPDEATTSSRLAVWGVRLLAFGIISYAGLGLLGLPDSFASVVLAIAAIAMIAGATPIEFWIVDGLRGGLDRAGAITERGDILASLLTGLVKVAIVLGNLLLLAEALNIPYGAALAGFGIGGLAVALAARSTLENVIAGFILFADRPIAVGDFCRFGSQLGTIERIGIRSTTVRTLGRTVVAVPNADFVNMHLENFARRDSILLRRTIALRHDTTPDQLRYALAGIRRLLIAHPRLQEDPRARFLGFGDHAIEIEIFAYVRTTDWAEFLAIGEDVMLRIMETVEEAGTDFAMPTQTLHLGRDPGTDAARTETAEAAVARWREARDLPFPDFTPDEIERLRASLAYPPEGAPEARPDAGPADRQAYRGGHRGFWPFAGRRGRHPRTS